MNNIVAAEAGKWGLRLYFHDGKTFRTETVPFSPFILLDKDTAAPENCRLEELSGSGKFCRQLFYDDFDRYHAELPELKKLPGVFSFNSLLQQALTGCDLNLFGGMDFDQLRRMYFSMQMENDVIKAVEVADSDGYTAVFHGSEAQIITAFKEQIKIFDPDILGGFNCCREELPLLVKRAKKLKITLDCGRNGGVFSAKNSRFSAGEKQYSYQRFSLEGRHVIDLYHAVLLYDAAHRDLEDLELLSLREYFHLSGNSAAELISQLADILLPAYFYRTRELPLGFQDALLRGSGSALDALLIAKYLQKRCAIPVPEVARPYAGALSGMEKSGVFYNVRHCDVRSLYPSLLLLTGTAPARDELGIFLELLARLRTFRLEAKDRAKQLPAGKEKRQLEALQSSFKILINSFYGYLGFAQGCFNDFSLAEKITASGREILGRLTAALQQCQAEVIEMDTDGIYFQMPQCDMCRIDKALQDVLPAGIDLEFDADYPAMFSYKAKNYALLHSDGSVTLTGAALKSRALEPFQRKFIMEIVSARLHGDQEAESRIYRYYYNAIADRTIALEDLAKSEVLSDSPENYRRKLASGSGRRSAPYELALASNENFRAGDRVKFFVTGEKAKVPVVGNSKLLSQADPDRREENTAYYLAKLQALAETFSVKA